MKLAGNRISQISIVEIIGAKGENKAAMKPTIVIGATTGAASMFAMMLIGDTYPDKATTTGEQKIIAAIGGATAPANFLLIGNRSRIIGAKSNNPAVAKTESAKPASLACQGSPITTAAIAKPSAGMESVARLLAWANIKTAAIAAARRTEGEGRTSAIKQISAIDVASSR